jgi:uncharacterized protein (DUF1778 family)
MATPLDSRSERIHIRASPEQANLIKAGALRKGESITDYILKSMCVQAEIDLANQTHFSVPKEKWAAFLKELDRPPRVPAGLKRLFSKPSIAESR